MASGPLDGVKVLEFGQIYAAPLACQMLSDLGADVVKVEPVEGEPWRINNQFVPFESKGFQALNRGKRSLAIDLSKPEGQAAVHRLVKRVDVVVVNYRADVAKNLHIDYQTLAAIRPELIYADNTAFGRKGELAERPGFDIVAQAMAGVIAAIGKVDEEGAPVAVLSPPFLDTTTAYAIVGGVCAALYHRAMTGQGQLVETSLLINALTIHATHFVSNPAADAEQRRDFFAATDRASAEGKTFAEFLASRGSLTGANPGFYYRCYVTCDGAVAVGALSASLRAKLRTALKIEHNRDEAGYDLDDPQQQVIDRETTRRVEELFRTQSSDYWEALLGSHGVPVSRVNFVQTLQEHPQVVANDYVIELEHDLTGPQWMAAPPWKMSVTPPAAQGASPPLGRDTDAILTDAGLSAREISQMRRKGVIR